MKTVAYCTTRQWNPGDEFILLGAKNIVEKLIGKHNAIIYNRSPEVRPSCGLVGFRNNKNEEAYHLDYIRACFFDNSIKFDSDLSYVDLAVFAGTPEWQNERCLNFYEHIIKNNIPVIVLGVGSYRQPCSIVKEVLSKTRFISFRDAKFLSEMSTDSSAMYLPCPALMVALKQKEKRIYFVKHIGLGFAVPLKDTVKWNEVSQQTFDYLLALYHEIITKEKCKVSIVCHYIDELALAHQLFDKYGVDILYSYDSKDYIDIYHRFDLVISSRVHGCGIAASMGIPTVSIVHDFRGTTTRGFMSDCVSPNMPIEDVFERIHIIKKSIRKHNKAILKHKHNTLKQYVKLLSESNILGSVDYQKNVLEVPQHDVDLERRLGSIIGPTFISFDCVASRDTECRVYYIKNHEEKFSEDNSVGVQIRDTDNQAQYVNIGLPVESLAAIRIDVGNLGDSVSISNLTMRVHNSDIDMASINFITYNLKILNNIDGAVTFTPMSDDPQLIYQLQ